MESSHLPPPHVDGSRPSLGFPLGTALLLIIIFSLSSIFSCCYYWDKLRSLRPSFSENAADQDGDIESSSSKSNSSMTELKKIQGQSFPVLMPGDEIPKFIALPSPCEPQRPEKVVVKVRNPSPKPPPRFPMPLY